MEYSVKVESDYDLQIIKTIHLNKNDATLMGFFKYLVETGKTDRYYENYKYGYIPILGRFPEKWNFSLSWKYYDGNPFLEIKTSDGKTDLMSFEDAVKIGKQLIDPQ
jgi:hypothetical protein